VTQATQRPPTPRDIAQWIPPPRPRTPAWRSARDLVGRRWLTIFAGLVVLYLFIPIIVTILFSFNDNLGRFNFTWQSFTLKNWQNACGVPGLCPAMGKSLQVAALATAIATVLGTLIAFALVRYRFRGRRPTSLALFLPMATPEIVMGTSLLALFLNVGMQRGFRTIVIGHVMFNISFVVVTVRARLEGQDANLEEAAMDLYADEWTTFRKVTLPLAMPGIIAGALLAFALSFDDFVITNFVSGNTITFPMFVWGAAQRGIPPQVNVMATLMFVVAVAVSLIGLVAARRR
jgi:spermidine/putrescine transport system permease protein